MAEVTLDKVCKWYSRPEEPVVDHVSFTVGEGEFVVLLGPSGCGKSTTLRMIAGLEAISTGTLTIDGAVMNRVPARDRDIAMVFQSYALYPHMSVRDNLSFGLRRRGFVAEEIHRRVRDVAHTLEMTALLERKPHALSGGQRQRVALGRAIVRNPKVFLFDEPLSNLDAALRLSTRNELIKQHHRLKATMIYVTHDQVEAMTMGDRICVMDKGILVQVGAPMDVYRRPNNTFVARFLGSPPMNLMPGRVITEDGHIAVGVAGVNVPLAAQANPGIARYVGQDVVFGIRPEDLHASGRAGSDGRTVPFRAKVDAVEPLGAETLVVVSAPDVNEEIVARMGRETVARVGEPITLHLDVSSVRIFDKDTTLAIS
jgi:multiple sugar transport system ATP-binding protein